MAESLFAERRQIVEKELCEMGFECTTSAAATTLYIWAGEVLQQLQERNGDVPPKLRLAEALGITTDPRWRNPNRDGPVEPRHRVVARFARENRLNSLWSLNWDCLLENALERVGLSRGVPRADLPWKTQFTTFLTVADYVCLGSQQSVPVFKPHGCVRQLVAARAALDRRDYEEARRLSSRFRITKNELDAPDLDPDETHLHANLGTRLAQSPLIVVGWSITEGYLRQLIQQNVAPALQARARALAVDELSIVDLIFSDGHGHIAAAYGRSQGQVHFVVEENGFTMDALWLWLQALYTLQHLRACQPNQETLAAIYTALQAHCANDWIIWWADEWLPAWCRLCWQFGCVTCFHNNVPVPPERLDLEAPDAHVPLDLKMPRPDLVAAGSLLARLWPMPAPWKFRVFPGALFDEAQGQLVLPVPTWPSLFRHSERALKPLMDLWKPHLGIVRSVSLLGLDGGLQTANSAIDHWRQALSRAVPTSRFADPQNVTTFNFNEL